jgi:hypothetical protein
MKKNPSNNAPKPKGLTDAELIAKYGKTEKPTVSGAGITFTQALLKLRVSSKSIVSVKK